MPKSTVPRSEDIAFTMNAYFFFSFFVFSLLPQ